jgi:hypothetical protein
MFPELLDRVGDWNPQLLRELKGRMQPRSMAVAVGGAVIFQTIFLMSFWQALPREGSRFSRYCLDVGDPCTINWAIWWQDQFRTISWILPYIFFSAGVYALVADLIQEERRGTLNFIRLSPRSSFSIMLGKMLGVPILSYIAVALIVPLHLTSAFAGGVPLGFVFSYYLMLLATGIFLFSAALLQALLGGDRMIIAGRISSGPIVFAFLTFFFTSLYMAWNLNTAWSSFSSILSTNRPINDFQWFYFQLAENPINAHIFSLGNLAIFTYGIWQVLSRRFNNPGTTVLSKQQSYCMIAYLEVFMLGFCLYSTARTDTSVYVAQFAVLYFLNLFCFLILIASTVPYRQALLDWVRYGLRPGGIVRDLIWAEKSPAPVAIAINLVISNALIVPWIMLWPDIADSTYKLKSILTLVLFATTVLIYAILVQLITFMRTQRPGVWAVGTVASVMILPPIFLSLLTLTPDRVPLLWIILGFPIVNEKEVIFLVGIVVQLIIIGILGFRLAQLLQRAKTISSQTPSAADTAMGQN